MAYETIKYEVAEQILTITLNRPDKLNAFNGTMQQELIDAFDAADKDDDVRAIIVTGAGRGFCAGADLSSGANTFDRDARRGPVKRLADGTVDYSDPAGARRRRPGDAAHLQVPEARDRGGERAGGRHRRHHAAGDGYPHRLARPRASASCSPSAASCRRRPRAGSCRASSASRRRWSGATPAACSRRRKRWPAASSARWCRRTSLLPTARALAKEIAAKTAPVSVALIRQMMWRMLGADDPMEAHKVDSRGIYARGRSDDVKEGVVSFLEKRPAQFKNKVSSDMPDYFPWWDEREYK